LNRTVFSFVAADVLIRRLSMDEFTELTALLHRAYASLADMGLRYVATYQDEETTRVRCAAGETYVAESEGALCGTITFRPAALTMGTPWYDRPEVASFGQFAVEPTLQGKGIGALLMDVVEARARETGATELALDTAEPAAHLIELYERRGYRFIEHAQWDVTNYRSVIMSKRLLGQ
jgi:GNAT superfamily N-acetyltransferase